MRILTADIGGTHSRFGLLERDNTAGQGDPVLVDSVWLPTAKVNSFAALLDLARREAPRIMCEPAAAAAFAVAGPVENGIICRPPNIGWDIDLNEVRPLLPATRVFLLNDFVAQAMACTAPHLVDARLIYSGEPPCHSPVAVVGAGTGLGKCLLLPGSPPSPLPSEGGHTLFPFIGPEEFAFAEFAAKHTQRRIIGDVAVSGMGLRLLYAFHTGEWREPKEVAAALTPDHPVERWFARFYGRACQAYVLETLALGGLFIAGGVAASNPNLIIHPAFLEEFRNSEAHRHLLERIPVLLVHGREAALYGAALYALARLK